MKLFSKILLLAVIVIILVYLSFYFAETIFSPVVSENPQNQVCLARRATAEGFGSKCFYVELAETEADIERGLMDRKELDKDKGMLFIFGIETVRPFWMKNTLIPLDIIWIDSNNKIVFISQNAQPCPTAQAGKDIVCPVIDPKANAKYVLEVNAGVASELNLKIGDSAELKISNK